MNCQKMAVYSRLPLSRTLKGNGKLFEIAGVVSNFVIFNKSELQ